MSQVKSVSVIIRLVLDYEQNKQLLKTYITKYMHNNETTDLMIGVPHTSAQRGGSV